MCLKPQTLPPIPEETRRLAQQLFPAHHVLHLIGDEYADLLQDTDFADLYSPLNLERVAAWQAGLRPQRQRHSRLRTLLVKQLPCGQSNDGRNWRDVARFCILIQWQHG